MRFSQIYNWYTTGMTSKYQLGSRENPEATGHLVENSNFFFSLNMYTTLTKKIKKKHSGKKKRNRENAKKNKLSEQKTMHKQFRPWSLCIVLIQLHLLWAYGTKMVTWL